MPTHTRQSTVTNTTTQSSGSGSAGSAVKDRQSLMGNEELAQRLQAKKPTHTGIVHFGLNGGAATEAGLLDKKNADKGGAKSIRNQQEQDVLVRGGKRMDLASEDGRRDWLATLGLGEDTITKVDAILRDAGGGARDELGQLVEVYAQAETGERRMDRLVLSGHNVGAAMWGDDNGSVPFSTFVDFRDAFPSAAGQVRHLMASACYSGGEKQMDTYREAFPGLLSIMAYTGSSPGTYSGAQNHLTRWEKATEKGDGSNVDQDIAKNTRKGENVATWNAKDGYQGDEPTPLSEVEAELSQGEAVYERYYTAGEAVTDPQSGELRTYYNQVQRALRHPEIGDARRPELEERRDKTIRLLFYHLIRARFSQQYASELQSGYSAAEQTLPAYATLPRADALTAIGAFRDAGADGGAVALDLLQRGLVELDSTVIPEQWI